MAYAGLFGHLQHDFAAELLGVEKDVGQFGLHESVWVFGGVFLGVDSSPGRADDECVCLEGLYG